MEELKVKILTKNDDILRTKCVDVDKIDDSILSTLDAMLDKMYESRGVGLAGNQVGINKRLITIDLQENEVRNPIFLINPKIVSFSKETICEEEGCLSLPGQRAKVKRYARVDVEYLDRNGKLNKIIGAEGFFSICLQHEIDHLSGVLYIDHLSKLKRDMIISKVRKFLK